MDRDINQQARQAARHRLDALKAKHEAEGGEPITAVRDSELYEQLVQQIRLQLAYG